MRLKSIADLKSICGAILATLIGIAFFNLVVGVFGLPAAIISLVLFVALAVMVFRRPQAGEPTP
jgi:uncharacterized membrane protein YuzA (DUF378 family)